MTSKIARIRMLAEKGELPEELQGKTLSEILEKLGQERARKIIRQEMNLFKEHAGHDVEIQHHSNGIGDRELGEVYYLWCEDCEEEIISDEVFK